MKNMSDNDFNFNALSYFTNFSIAGLIFFIVGTYLLTKYILRKKKRRIISLSKKSMTETDEGGDFYHLTTIGDGTYDVCKKMYDSLSGHEIMEIVVKGDELLEITKIIKK
jgi:hypothetical protein